MRIFFGILEGVRIFFRDFGGGAEFLFGFWRVCGFFLNFGGGAEFFHYFFNSKILLIQFLFAK